MKKATFPPGIFTLLTVTVLVLLLSACAEGYRSALLATRRSAALYDAAEAYYQGEAALQQTLARVDEALLTGEDPAQIPGVTRVENRLLAAITLADGRQLTAELTLAGPDSGLRYRLTGYSLQPG